MPSFPEAARGLYAIVDPEHCDGRDPAVVAVAILRGGCAVLQLRAKRLARDALVALARQIASEAGRAGVPFVVNDHVDVALLAGADGAHLGQTDLPVAAARALAPGLVLGVSTHDAAQARGAVAAGADLIGFGPVFPTATKDRPDPVVGLEALACVVRDTPVPVVAIGGVTWERAAGIRAAGARLGAAIGAVCGASDPELSARRLHARLRGDA